MGKVNLPLVIGEALAPKSTLLKQRISDSSSSMDWQDTREILSVSALNEQIKGLLEGEFPFVWVEGEVSNLRRPASGHLYFTLKDEQSQIRAVIFRNAFSQRGRGQEMTLEEGMKVVCRARLTVYAPRGEYQLIVEALEPKGLGALQKAFEQLKARLEAEGLFAAARKRPLPFLPQGIAVVTSPTGAVIRDILTITGRRFPSVNILIAPVRVQGSEAPAEIIRALEDVQQREGIDVVIVARGGGSLEDLAPFNDEGVARAIARCRLPVISAIGHETDYTIADFTADLRAPTPSAAAELVVPLRAELRERIEGLHLRLIRQAREGTARSRRRVEELAGRLRHPRRILTDLRLTLDEAVERMRNSILRGQRHRRHELQGLAARLERRDWRLGIAARRLRLKDAALNLVKAWQRSAEMRANRLARAMALLDSLSPLAVLRRGYSITKRLRDGLILRKAEGVRPGEGIAVRLAEGGLAAVVTEIFKEWDDGQGKI